MAEVIADTSGRKHPTRRRPSNFAGLSQVTLVVNCIFLAQFQILFIISQVGQPPAPPLPKAKITVWNGNVLESPHHNPRVVTWVNRNEGKFTLRLKRVQIH